MSKIVSVVVKVFLNHPPGCPVIHDPRQVCIELENMLGCITRFFVSKNVSVVVKVFLNHSPGCPVIHDPRQVCIDLVNMNSRVLVPWNDSDFTAGFIK